MTTSVARARRADFLAANPFERPYTDGLFYREKMRAIHAVAPPSAIRVLEVGGGRSGLASLLYPGASITTVDLDRTALGQGPGAEATAFVEADGRILPFPDATFDVVTLFDVIEHVKDDHAIAAEARRVAAPGGCVLITTPHAAWRYPHHRVLARWCPPAQSLMDDWGHVRIGYEPDDLDAMFGEAVTRTDFINPLTAIYHDIGFSHLSGRKRRALQLATFPLVATGYALHRVIGRGAELAVRYRT